MLNNNLFAIWQGTTITDNVKKIYFSKSSNFGQSWIEPKRISQIIYEELHPNLIIDSDAKLHLVYSAKINDYYQIIYFNSSDYGTLWNGPFILTNTQTNKLYPFILKAKNDLFIVWEESTNIKNIYLAKNSDNGTSSTWNINNIFHNQTLLYDKNMPKLCYMNNILYLTWCSRNNTYLRTTVYYAKWLDEGINFDISENYYVINPYYNNSNSSYDIKAYSIIVDKSNLIHICFTIYNYTYIVNTPNFQQIDKIYNIWNYESTQNIITNKSIYGLLQNDIPCFYFINAEISKLQSFFYFFYWNGKYKFYQPLINDVYKNSNNITYGYYKYNERYNGNMNDYEIDVCINDDKLFALTCSNYEKLYNVKSLYLFECNYQIKFNWGLNWIYGFERDNNNTIDGWNLFVTKTNEGSNGTIYAFANIYKSGYTVSFKKWIDNGKTWWNVPITFDVGGQYRTIIVFNNNGDMYLINCTSSYY